MGCLRWPYILPKRSTLTQSGPADKTAHETDKAPWNYSSFGKLHIMTLTFWLEFLQYFFSFTWVIFDSNIFLELNDAPSKLTAPLLLSCCHPASVACFQHVRYANNDEGKCVGCWHYLVCSPHILPYLIVPTQTGICLISRSVDTS